MANQKIALGTLANDGTGDTLRAAGQKINQNFAELYEFLGGDSAGVTTKTKVHDSSGITFEGTTVNGTVIKLSCENPTASRSILLPNASGIIALADAGGVLQSKTLVSPVLKLPQIHDNDSSHQYLIKGGALTADHNVNLPAMTDSDTIAMIALTQTLTNKTLTSPVVVAPVLHNKVILDSGNNEILTVVTASSAVNNININNAATGLHPGVSAVGTDTNINLALASKGTGAIDLSTKTRFGSESVSTAGALSLSVPLTIFNAPSAIAVSLPNGTETGETKYFINKNSGTATITFTSRAGSGTTEAFTQDQAGQMIWDGSEWFLVAKQSN